MSRNFERTDEEETKILISSVDYAVLIATVMLVLAGIIMVFSASYYSSGISAECNYDIYFYLKKHSLWAVLGFVVMYFMSNFNYNKLRKFITPFYIICNIFLIMVLFMGKEVNGAK